MVRERNEMDVEGVNCDLEREERRKVHWEVAVTFGTDGESRPAVGRPPMNGGPTPSQAR